MQQGQWPVDPRLGSTTQIDSDRRLGSTTRIDDSWRGVAGGAAALARRVPLPLPRRGEAAAALEALARGRLALLCDRLCGSDERGRPPRATR